MTNYSDRKAAANRKVRQYLQVSNNSSPAIPPYAELLQQEYPGVPEAYQSTWQHSDDHLSENPQWQSQLLAAADALQQAANLCHRLAENPPKRTTPVGLLKNKNKLLRAIHGGEDLLTELGFKYPLPTPRNYAVAKEDPQLTECIPQLLLNTPEHIILWLPRLPSKKRSTDSLSYMELKELLWENRFAHLDNWHCDLIHTYHPDHQLGVLDVDNYLYKPIIDALALAFSTSDRFERFSCSMYSMATTKLKPGCYIHVQEKTEKVRELENFIFTETAETDP